MSFTRVSGRGDFRSNSHCGLLTYPYDSCQVFLEERRKQRCHRKLTAQNLMLAALDFLMGHKQQVQDLVHNPGPTADKMSAR